MAEKVLIDLSHPIEHGMVTYRGLPGPVIGEYITRETSRPLYGGGAEFSIGRIDMVANTGTYIDAPFHRYADGDDLAGLPLEKIAALDGICVRMAPSRRKIDADAFAGVHLRGRALLVHTGWDRLWGTPAYMEGNPFLTRDAAALIVEGGVKLAGIDSYNIDDTADGTRPAHSILLKAGVPIVEHLCGLGRLPREGFTFFAVPPMVRAMGSFPVRAFAVVMRE